MRGIDYLSWLTYLVNEAERLEQKRVKYRSAVRLTTSARPIYRAMLRENRKQRDQVNRQVHHVLFSLLGTQEAEASER